MAADNENLIKFIIKWASKEYTFDNLESDNTILDLKESIYSETGVKPERQKLMGLKTRSSKFCRCVCLLLISNKHNVLDSAFNDETKLNEIVVRPGLKIMMIGSREEQIANIDLDPSEIPNVINDFDIDEDLNSIAIHNREEYLAKIEKRIRDYKVTVFNPPRPGKKLLVLDIDYTLFGMFVFNFGFFCF